MNLSAIALGLGLLVSATPVYADTAEHADRRGDHFDRYLDRAAGRAEANGRDLAAECLDERGDRMDRRLDRRGETIDRTLDRRGRQIDRRIERRATRV
jgi:hypothetical protein